MREEEPTQLGAPGSFGDDSTFGYRTVASALGARDPAIGMIDHPQQNK